MSAKLREDGLGSHAANRCVFPEFITHVVQISLVLQNIFIEEVTEVL